MKSLYFATSNKEKVLIAQTICSGSGIKIKQADLEINEIQGEDPLVILKDKVIKAYKKLKKPVVVSDDSWDIPALNGFPGPYMKSLNNWFTPYDFLRLMNGLKDRNIIVHKYLAFYDGKTLKVFSDDMTGKIIDAPRGKNKRSPNATITVLDADNGKTIAEVFELGAEAVANRYKNHKTNWHEFIDWYSSRS